MRLAIVGGKLQGIEAAYLAAKAGYETVLVDRREAPPAAGLADRHVVMDVTADEARSRAVLGACDAVLPACEDDATLAWLVEHLPRWDVPLLFDLDSYAVTSSKLASNELFARLDVPRPRPVARGCGFPVVVKPSAASGSEGVRLVRDEHGTRRGARASSRRPATRSSSRSTWPALRSRSRCSAGTDTPCRCRRPGLEFDEGYDCKRVVAPVGERVPRDGGRRDARRGRLGARRSAGRARRLRRGDRPPRRGPRAARPHGRRGDGPRRPAEGARDRRPAAQPDADRGLLVERAQHRRAAVADLSGGRLPAVDRGPRGPASSSTSTRAMDACRSSAST